MTGEPLAASDDDHDPTSDADAVLAANRASVGRNVAHMLNAQVVTWVVALVTSAVVPRFLGPALVGQLRLAGSLWLIGGIFVSLGTQRFLQLEIARSATRGLRLVGPTLVLLTLTFALVASVLAGYVALTSSNSTFVVIMCFSGFVALLTTWTDTYRTSFVGLEQMAVPALADASARIATGVLTIALLALGTGVYGLLSASVIASSGLLAVLATRFHRISPIIVRGWRRAAPEIVRGSLPFMFAGAALVVYQQVDIVVISWAAGEEDLGWYGTADTLFGSLLFPAVVLTSTIFPTLGRLGAGNGEEMRALVSRTFAALVVVAVPIGFGTSLIAPSFAPLLYGEKFRETGDVLVILGPVVVLTFGTILFGAVAQAIGRVRFWTTLLLVSATLTVPLDLVLVPWSRDRFDNGAIGGAMAYVVTEAFQFTVGLCLIAPYLLNRTTVWRVTRVVLAGLIMVAAGLPLRDSFIALPIVVSAIVYAAALLVLRALSDDERRVLGKLLARLGLHTRWVGI